MEMTSTREKNIRDNISQMGRHDIESFAELFNIPFTKVTDPVELAKQVADAYIEAVKKDEIIVD